MLEGVSVFLIFRNLCIFNWEVFWGLQLWSPSHSAWLTLRFFSHLDLQIDKLAVIRKDPDAGKDWRQEEKGMTKDEMVGWHHQLDRHEFEWTPGAGDGQGGLVCCGSWGCKESDMTEWLNWTELNLFKGELSLQHINLCGRTQLSP